MSIIAWIVVGLIAGLLARAIMPGPQHMGLIATTLLGIVGSVIGGLVGSAIWGRNGGQFAPGGIILSVIGAFLVLLVLGFVRRPARV